MEEKIELNLTSYLSDNNSTTSSVRTFDTMDSKVSLFGNEPSLQYSQDTFVPTRPKHKKTTILVFTQLLITAVSIVAIILSVVAVTSYYLTMKQQEEDIKMLKKEINELKQMVNMSNVNDTMKMNAMDCLSLNCLAMDYLSSQVVDISHQIETVSESVNNLYEHVNSSYGHIENQVDKAIQLSQNLGGNISQLNSTLMSNLGRIMSVNNMITTLDSRIQAINTDLSSTVNLYDNCIVNHEMCQGGQLSNIYWRVCRSPPLPLNTTVSYQKVSIDSVHLYIRVQQKHNIHVQYSPEPNWTNSYEAEPD